MSTHSLPQSSLGHEEIVLRRTANGLGVSYAGLEGTLGDDAHRILIRLVIPKRIEVDVRFITKPTGAIA